MKQSTVVGVVKNSQTLIVKRALYYALFFVFTMVVPPMVFEATGWVFALSFVSIAALLSALIVAWMYHLRAKKLESLIDESKLVARWRLDSEQKAQYAHYMFETQKAKNKILFSIMVVMFVLIFGIFIAMIEAEARMSMFLAMIGFIAFLSLFAFGMPYYYRQSNLKADGEILIGTKFAYIDGQFHNWDFPLSGLKDARVIQTPFYALHLRYYYIDRTLRNSFELNIPANKDSDLQTIIDKLLQANSLEATTIKG